MKKIMQIGYGYWGNNVANKLMQSDQFELEYLCEVDSDKRKKAKNSLKNVAVIDEYNEALNKVDCVAICTQTKYSFQIAMDAMEKGKHVFIEKPLAENYELGLQLAKKSKEKRVILHCDHLMMYNPVIRYIKNMIDNGEIGEIMYIDIERVNLGPIRKDINAMYDLAVHDIAVSDYLLGKLNPETINALGTTYFGGQDNITYLTMKNKDTLINICSSWVSPVKVRRTAIAGTKKMLIFDDVKQVGKLRIYDSGIDVKQGDMYGEYEFNTRVGDVYIPHIDYYDSLLASINHFGDCIESGQESLSGPTQSLRVMNILDKAVLQMEKLS